MKWTVFLLVANLVCVAVNTSLALVFVRPASTMVFVEGCIVGLNLVAAFLMALKLCGYRVESPWAS